MSAIFEFKGTRLLLRAPLGLSLAFLCLGGAELDLSSAVKQFMEHSYDLQIARMEPQKARADVITANEHPNPVWNTTYEFMNIEKNFNDTARGSNAQLTSTLVHIIETAGKRDKRVELATRTVAYQEMLFDETVREQLSGLMTAYFTLLADQTDLANARENRKAYAAVVATAKAKLDHGFLSAIDYQKIALQQLDYDKEVETGTLAVAQDSETLAAMLALPSIDITAVSPTDAPERFPSLATLLDDVVRRPDCKAAMQNRTVAEAAWRVEQAIAVPNVNVMAEYASFGPVYEPLLGLGVSMPLPIFDRNAGDIEKARIATLQASAMYDKTLRAARADVIQSYKAYYARATLYEAMRSGFAGARELKDKQEKLFALKGISVLELLDAQKSYRDYQKNMTHAVIDLKAAAAMLKLSAGLPLVDSPKGF